MLLVVSNKMSKKILSQDSNSKEWYDGDPNDHAIGLYIQYLRSIEAKKLDDYIFQDYEED